MTIFPTLKEAVCYGIRSKIIAQGLYSMFKWINLLEK